MNRQPGPGARGFGTGILAGVAATLVLFAYRMATGVPTPAEVLTERMIRLLPFPVFALILATLQHWAKPLGFLMALITSLVGFGLGGVIYTRMAWDSRRPRLTRGLVAAAVTWVCLTYVFLPGIQGGILGAPLTTVVPAPALPMALGSLVYGLLMAGLSPQPGQRGIRRDRPASGPASSVLHTGGSSAVSVPVSRRDLLRRSALVALVAAAAARLGTWGDATEERVAAVVSGAAAVASGAFRLIRGMPPEVTSNREFYQVSKNYPFDPTVDVATWSLEVGGLVGHPLKLSYADFVRAAPSVERYQTLECISNEVGGDLISTARWKGIRIRDILALADVRPEARTVIWHSADGYFESLPLDAAMDPESLLAYEMNGAPLPQNHGAPVRVLLPNRYGTKQPKWLTGIEVASSDFPGYWQRQRLNEPAIVKTGSAFRVERQEGPVVLLGGWAFAGSRGISKVEISADGGTTWFPAAVKEALGENCWQFWSAEWKPPAPGEYSLKVRAVDGTGRMQAGRWRRMPDGAEGYHEVRIRVAG
jgi:DMSO/TMAO reductase YedYZ molybdopterin-dependent catalytic subunit